MDRVAFAPKAATLVALIFAVSYSIAGQTDSVYRLPAGTRIKVRMDAEITSRAASKNDTFIAIVTDPVSIEDAVVLPTGSQVEGRVTFVTHASALGHNGRLELRFEKVRIAGTERQIDGLMVEPLTAPTDRGIRLAGLAGATAAGTLIGAAGHAIGIGGAAGAAAGIGFAVLKKGREVAIAPDQGFEIELKKEVLLPASNY